MSDLTGPGIKFRPFAQIAMYSTTELTGRPVCEEKSGIFSNEKGLADFRENLVLELGFWALAGRSKQTLVKDTRHVGPSSPMQFQ